MKITDKFIKLYHRTYYAGIPPHHIKYDKVTSNEGLRVLSIQCSIVRIIYDNDNDNDKYDYDTLELINNYYIPSNDTNVYEGEVVLRIGSIRKLNILNIHKYYTDEYRKLFDRVVNGGEIELYYILFDSIDCNRFSSVKLYCTIILNINNKYCNFVTNSCRNCNKFIYYKNLVVNGDVYSGCGYIKNNKLIKDSICNIKYKNRNVFEGILLSEEIWYYGIMRYANGDVYEGKWLYNNKNGYGIMRYANGDVYEGRWKDNKKSIYGTMRYANGDVYRGSWYNDLIHGTGVMKYANGTIHKGKCYYGTFCDKN